MSKRSAMTGWMTTLPVHLLGSCSGRHRQLQELRRVQTPPLDHGGVSSTTNAACSDPTLNVLHRPAEKSTSGVFLHVCASI